MISNLVRKAVEPDDTFNAYCYFYNGVFEHMLTRIPGVTLYGDAKKSHYTWKNYFSLDSVNIRQMTLDQIPFNDVQFDAVICNHRIKSHEAARNAAMYLNVPLVIIDHLGPDKTYSSLDIEVVKSAYKGNSYVAANKAALKWGQGDLIPYFVDIPTEQEPERINDYIFSGDYTPQDFLLIQEIAAELKTKYRIIGGAPGNNTQVVNLYEELEEAFLQSKVYIHLPTANTITYELLLAMACGCAIVSSRTEAVETILKDDENAILVRNVEEVAPMARALANDETKIKKFAEVNSNLLKTEFSKENFVSKWQDKIHTIKRELFVP